MRLIKEELHEKQTCMIVKSKVTREYDQFQNKNVRDHSLKLFESFWSGSPCELRRNIRSFFATPLRMAPSTNTIRKVEVQSVYLD